MGMLQERADLTERDLATYRHDVGTLRAERDHLVNQVGAAADSIMPMLCIALQGDVCSNWVCCKCASQAPYLHFSCQPASEFS
jgi:hypothetical protein